MSDLPTPAPLPADSDSDHSAAPRSAVRQVPVGPEEVGQRLDRLLTKLLPGVPRTRVFRLIRKGEVRVNSKRTTPEARLALGDVVRVPPVREQTPEELAAPRRVPASLLAQIEAAIIHEDPKVLVLDKPAGVAVHGGSGLSFGVIESLRASRPHETLELAHRLDRDTSGVLLIARKGSALRELHALLRDGEVKKSYLVLVRGRWELGAKQIDAPLDTEARVGGERTVRVAAHGKQAITDFKLVQQFGPRASLLEATILTGRTHQIRVHAAYAGHPVAGDDKYGDAQFNELLRELGLTRMFLHAHSCSLQWPGAGDLDVSAPLPDALKSVLDALGDQRGGQRADKAREPRLRYRKPREPMPWDAKPDEVPLRDEPPRAATPFFARRRDAKAEERPRSSRVRTPKPRAEVPQGKARNGRPGERGDYAGKPRARPGSARPGSSRPGAARPASSRPGASRTGAARSGATRASAGRPGQRPGQRPGARSGPRPGGPSGQRKPQRTKRPR